MTYIKNRKYIYMILEILLCIVLLCILIHNHESMTCKDVTIEDAPIASIYDVKNNGDTLKNDVFQKDYNSYNESLKTYFSNLKKYCNI